jgi:hypothetical protein
MKLSLAISVQTKGRKQTSPRYFTYTHSACEAPGRLYGRTVEEGFAELEVDATAAKAARPKAAMVQRNPAKVILRT